jgi:hypothetical protein
MLMTEVMNASNSKEKRLLLAGMAMISKVTLERGQVNYKVDFISVRKPNGSPIEPQLNPN